MKYLLTGILAGAGAVIFGVALVDRSRKQQKEQNASLLVDKLSEQLKALEDKITAERELLEVGAKSRRRKNGAASASVRSASKKV